MSGKKPDLTIQRFNELCVKQKLVGVVGVAPTKLRDPKSRGSTAWPSLRKNGLPSRSSAKTGQGGEIRTHDLPVPNGARCSLRYALKKWWRRRELHPSQTCCEQASPLRHMRPRKWHPRWDSHPLGLA